MKPTIGIGSNEMMGLLPSVMSRVSSLWPRINDVVFLFDIENNRFFWDGAEKTLADATDNLDGTYNVDLATPIDVTNSSGFVEVTEPATPATNETAFDFYNVGGAWFNISTSTTYGNLRVYDSGVANYANSGDPAGSNSVFKRYRAGWAYDVGFPRIVTNGYVGTAANTNGVGIASVDKIGIGWRRRFSDLPFSGTVHKVVIFSEQKTESELLEAAKNASGNQGFHWLGDSFLNSGQIRNDFDDLVVAAGKYAFSSTDQIGSTTLTQQAARYALTPINHSETLIIVDGGLTADDTSVAALTSIASTIPHDRWLYVQSNPVQAPGTGVRDDWDDEDAAILAYCGASHYLNTKDYMQAQSAGGDDATDVTNDIWPRSLLELDLAHPNASGQAHLADLIHARVVSEGWLL